MLEAALREAAGSGVALRFCDLGAWRERPLLAEYEPASRSIVVNERVVAGLRALQGDAFAARFAAFAIWHELYHASGGAGGERAAHAYAAAKTGLDVGLFERAARNVPA